MHGVMMHTVLCLPAGCHTVTGGAAHHDDVASCGVPTHRLCYFLPELYLQALAAVVATSVKPCGVDGVCMLTVTWG